MNKYRYYINKLFWTFLMVPFSLYCQTNLVPNPSFEDHSLGCPNGLGLISAVDNWFSPTDGTPDAFNFCANPSSVGVPDNFFGSQLPQEGNGYAGIYCYGEDDHREYLGVRLIDPLVIGQTYCVNFYVSLADNQFYGVTNLGIAFSTTELNVINMATNLDFTPQIEYGGNVIINQTEWVAVTGTFVADNDYDYIYIGNFKDNDESIGGGTIIGTPISLDAYYYIDNVSVIGIDSDLILTGNTDVCVGDDIIISATGGGDSYSWYDLANPTEVISESSIFVSTITAPISYLVVTNTGNCILTDTLHINPAPIPDVSFEYNTGCVGYPTTIINTSTNVWPNAITVWEIDGIADTIAGNYYPVFEEAGDYLVTLTIYNNEACMSSQTLPINIAATCDPCTDNLSINHNGNFESFNLCPTDLGQVIQVPHWPNPTIGTPDFFHSCYDDAMSNTSTDVPNNIFGQQESYSGEGYAGFYAYQVNNYREYLQNELAIPLQAGHQYFISCYVSLADTSGRAISNIGFYLSQDQVNFTDPPFFGVLPFTPQILNNTIISDKENWVQVSGYFTPTETINYLVIGNFTDNLNTNFELLTTGDLNFSYYYMDQLAVIEVSPIAVSYNQEILTNNLIESCITESIDLTAEGDYCNYWWIDLATGDTNSNTANLNISAQEAGNYNYILAAVLSGVTTYDTLQVALFDTPIPSFTVIEGCTNYPTSFINNSTSVGTSTTYEWDFDQDGIVDTTTTGSFNFLFENGGDYTTNLLVTNPGGCQASTTISFQVAEICDPCTLQNMITNPGFELYNDCPSELGAITNAQDWYSPTANNADLYSTCAINNEVVGIPDNNYGAQNLHSGGANYAGILAYADGDERSYITTPLLFPLEEGVEYCASMYVNLADESGVAIDFLGMYFSSSNVEPSTFNLSPQVLNEETDIIFGQSWVEIKGKFIADAAHTHLTIGNFFNNTETNALLQANGNLTNTAYYYIDDITVVPLRADIQAPDTICLGESIDITVIGNMCEHQWTSTTSTGTIGEASTLTVTPTVTTTYTYTGINELCDVTKTHTVVVIPAPQAGEDIVLCPGESATLTLENIDDATAIQWSPVLGLSNANIANPIANPSITTTYQVTVTYPWGTICPNTDEITVVRIQNFANAGGDATICDQATVQLNGSGGIAYSWFPTQGLSNPDIANPVATPSQTTTYTLTVLDENDCVSTDDMTITVQECDEGGPIYVNPNGTPFGDMLYDTIYQNTIDTLILPNLFDPDPNDQVVFNTFGPSHGIFTQGTDSSFYYPAVDYIGNDLITLVACDTYFPIECDTLEIMITVLPELNTPPLFNPPGPIYDTIYTGDLACIPISLFEYQEDDTVSLILIDNTPSFGNGSINNDTTCLNYTASNEFLGQDSLFISACDQNDTCSLLQIYLTILQDDVIAHDDVYTTEDGIPVLSAVLNNDTIPYSGIQTISIYTAPEHGEVLINSDQTLLYTPTLGFIGTDSYDYIICNNDWGCDTASVFITINNLLNAIDDSLTVPTNETTIIPAIANDELPMPDCYTITITDFPMYGIVILNNDGTISYTSNENYTGPDTFSYEICCAGYGCEIGVVNLTVQNLTPPIAVDDEYTYDMNTEMILNVLENDSDPNDLTITITSFLGVANGSMVNNGNQLIYTPDDNYFGTINTITYTICNSAGLCDEGLIIINILPVCDMFIPQGFSPNGDSVNDDFRINSVYTCDEFASNELVIFNRYGDVVYNQENYGFQGWWDGTWQKSNEPVPAGTYYYILKSTTSDRKNHLRGAVEVWR